MASPSSAWLCINMIDNDWCISINSVNRIEISAAWVLQYDQPRIEITNNRNGENRNAPSSSAMVVLELIHSQLTALPDEDQHILRENGPMLHNRETNTRLI